VNASSNEHEYDDIRIGPHEEFLELCALWTSGALSEADRQKLGSHLAVCPECRKAKQQFEEITDHAIPVIGAGQLEDEDVVLDEPFWSSERAESSFLARLRREELEYEPVKRDALSRADVFRLSAAATWRNVWTLYAAGILLAITLGLCAYDAGIKHERHSSALAASIGQHQPTEQSRRLDEIQHEANLAEAQIRDRDVLIANLRRKIQLKTSELNLFRFRQDQLTNELHIREQRAETSAQHRDELQEQYDTLQKHLLSLQDDLDSARQEVSEAIANKAELQGKVNDLTQVLKDRDSTVAEQDELLSHDRDIRELIGARDLHVAEVYDIAQTGETQKPYGRVFYTEGKSLIFYAYDLDQSRHPKGANIFQAWGRRGTDWKQALNLGIFYEDNASKKRWILKFDDAKMLAQIDAVFVTVEPRGGSQKPSSKPLLFAYLNTKPNHP
jgi:Putative zinc-finger